MKHYSFIVAVLLAVIAVFGAGNVYAGFHCNQAPQQVMAVSNAAQTDGGQSLFADYSQPYFPRRYRMRQDKSVAMEAFYLGLAGVGIFTWFVLSIQFFLAVEFAFWIVAALVFLFGTEAFWGGIDVLKEGLPGRFFAVMAVIFGIITVIPPVEWVLMYIESIIERALGKFDRFIDRLIFGKNYHPYYTTRRTVHIRRPYYRWFRASFS